MAYLSFLVITSRFIARTDFILPITYIIDNPAHTIYNRLKHFNGVLYWYNYLHILIYIWPINKLTNLVDGANSHVTGILLIKIHVLLYKFLYRHYTLTTQFIYYLSLRTNLKKNIIHKNIYDLFPSFFFILF